MASVRTWLDGDVWRSRVTLDKSAATGKRPKFQRTWPRGLGEDEARARGEEWLKTFEGQTVSGFLAEFASSVEVFGAPSASRPKANTAHAYRSMARAWSAALPDLPLAKLTARDVERAELALMARGVSAKTVNTYVQFLSSAFGWAIDHGIVESSPMAGVSHPGRGDNDASERCYSSAEARLIYSWMAAKRADGRADEVDRAAALAVMCMLVTGMRLGEVQALRVRDFRPSVPDLRVRATVVERPRPTRQDTPKRGESRAVSVPEDFAALLRAVCAPLGPYDLICGVGDAITPQRRVNGLLRACCASLGIEYRSAHALRHTHATSLINGGCSIVAVSRRLGHARPSTTLDFYASAGAAEDEALGREISRVLRCGRGEG